MIRTIVGDCRDVLPTMPASHFDCIVTSPPYWGLRSYLPDGHDDKHREIGAEPTLDAYVERMRGVARELWRVLKPRGTFFLNLGSCYASGGTRASRSRQPSRAQANGSDDKEPSGSITLDSACYGPDDEYQAGFLSRRGRTPDSSLPLRQSASPDEQTGQHIALLDSELRAELSRLSPKALSFLGYAPDAFALEATSSASLQQRQRYFCDAPPRTERASDRMTLSPESASRTLGKDVSEKAFDSPSEAFRRYLAIMSRNFKAKDLVDVPHIVMLTLQADGWYVRSAIVWAKRSPMPESVTDRPTSAYEMVFLLTKSERYFYDADAIAEESTYPGDNRALRTDTRKAIDIACADNGSRARTGKPTGETRNARNVWTIATQPYRGAHFATMPPDLAERCIKAGSSEKGCCPHCGKPWERVIERESRPNAPSCNGKYDGVGKHRSVSGGVSNDARERIDRGWHPSCACPPHKPQPARILDPFGGAGTTGLVADRLGRDATLIDLNPQYREMQHERLLADAPLFVEIA